MAKPKWITIGTAEGSMNGSSKITAAAYTGRVVREGTITGTTTGGASDTTAVSQVGAAEFITISTKTYTADKVGQSVTIAGSSNSANLRIVAGTSTIQGLTYKLAVEGVADASWDGNKDTTVDGDPGASAKYDFVLTVVVPNNKSEYAKTAKFSVQNANGDVTSGEITISQVAGVKTYATPVITNFGYNSSIPAWGGTAEPIIAWKQAWGWNGSTDEGTLSYEYLPGSTEGGVVAKFEGANKKNGVVEAPSKGITVSGATKVASVTVQITAHGKTSAKHSAVDVYQKANEISYGDVTFTAKTPSASDIPASGGTVGENQISWTGEVDAIAIQTISFTSRESFEISNTSGFAALTISKIAISYSDEIVATSKGTAVSARTEAGVITITATGAGDKTATKTLTIYQAANTATYGAVTIGQATPVSLAAPGETYAIVPALKQTVTYTSGATRTEATPADNKVQLSADYTVKTAKEGFSLDTNAGKVTVSLNPTTAPRNGFVVTISAEGEGGKTATKDITFNQQGSNSTLDLSPDTMSFTAAGETKTLTITSNDSWTLS